MANDQLMGRDFDVVVYGATGFTGSLVADYLFEKYGCNDSLRWAIAGRSATKLAAKKDALGAAAKNLATIVADSANPDELDALAKSTRVVLTTVGPYAIYGSDLVAACAENGTHYCDLAGEVQWIRKMIDANHDTAVRTGARLVHCCGFDSIPMDIGVWFLQKNAREKFGTYCESISLFVKATKGTASGGTLASMMNLIKESRQDRAVARTLVHPYSLNPTGQQDGPDKRDQSKVLYRDDAASWTAPFIMAGVNTKIVRRSHALNDFPYGKSFQYDESILTGRGISGWLKGQSVAVGLAALVIGASFAPTRKLLQRFVLAKPGEGPDEQLQRDGFFNLMQIGTLPDGRKIRTRITGDQDPGYGSTRKMLAESAVCLALDDLDIAGGSWTPASAMGAPLINRLQKNAGLTFELIES